MSDVTVVLDQGALHRLLEGADGPVAKELTRQVIRVDSRAKALCPVDTGRLRSSINWRIAHDSQGLVGIVGTNVDYAPFVEFGTRYTAAQAFLRPALLAAS